MSDKELKQQTEITFDQGASIHKLEDDTLLGIMSCIIYAGNMSQGHPSYSNAVATAEKMLEIIKRPKK